MEQKKDEINKIISGFIEWLTDCGYYICNGEHARYSGGMEYEKINDVSSLIIGFNNSSGYYSVDKSED